MIVRKKNYQKLQQHSSIVTKIITLQIFKENFLCDLFFYVIYLFIIIFGIKLKAIKEKRLFKRNFLLKKILFNDFFKHITCYSDTKCKF